MNLKQTATKVTIYTIIVNLLLSAFKLAAGLAAHSQAMISDSVHSASDVFSSIIVILGLFISQKEADQNHPYGHERFECAAAIVLAMTLAITGLMIGNNAFRLLFTSTSETREMPGVFALAAAAVSIAVKEGMYWYTRHYALQLDSGSLMADAWHHRSDALSSIGALAGILASRHGFPVCDALASLIICLFIIKAAYDIFMTALDQMVDHSCDSSTEDAMKSCILSHDGVLSIDFFQTRMFGNRIYVDLEISTYADCSLTQAHDLAEQVHHAIETEFTKVKHIMIHVNPHADATTGCQSEGSRW